MLLRPVSFIGQFVNNIQDLMSEGGDWREKFIMVLDAFDQLNKERSYIVNNQGTQITNFAEELAKFNLKQKDSDD